MVTTKGRDCPLRHLLPVEVAGTLVGVHMARNKLKVCFPRSSIFPGDVEYVCTGCGE